MTRRFGLGTLRNPGKNLRDLLLLRKHFSNWVSIAIMHLVHRDICRFVTREGAWLDVPPTKGYVPLALAKLLEHDWSIRPLDNYLCELDDKQNGIRFVCRLDSHIDADQLVHMFVEKKSEWLYGSDIFGKVVIDVGAHMGDTSISFALAGASLVIGIEPFKESFDLGVRNIQLNALQDRVFMINAALGVARGASTLYVARGESLSHSTTLSDSRVGTSDLDYITNVNTITLAEIASQFNLRRIGLLKLNCEGCEYGVVHGLSVEPPSATIDRIALQYHRGHGTLVDDLARAGFQATKVSYVTEGIGFIYAVNSQSATSAK